MPPVVIGIMWRLMFDPNSGPISSDLAGPRLDGQLNLLGDFSTALPAVIVVGVWAGMPQTTITLLAGLQGVDDELHEAAAVDGAGAWKRFRHITLPQLRPVIVAITSLDFIWNFNSFGLVYVLTDGGPGGKTMLPMLFAYNEAFRYGHFGFAAAMGNVMVVIIVGLLLFYLRSRLKEDRSMSVGRPATAARTGQYVALAAYMVFLGFPLLWLLSTAFKTTAEIALGAPQPDPADADAGATSATRVDAARTWSRPACNSLRGRRRRPRS